MSDPVIGLRPAAATDTGLDYVESLLADEGLPTGDVRAKQDCFYVAHREGDHDADGRVGDDEPVGVGGVEPAGEAALLRSVVVEPSARGDGVGSALCDALEAVARDDGVDALYLLTTTAAAFFAARGYEEVERSAVPAPMRDTDEFADLCPASATCLRKHLSE